MAYIAAAIICFHIAFAAAIINLVYIFSFQRMNEEWIDFLLHIILLNQLPLVKKS